MVALEVVFHISAITPHVTAVTSHVTLVTSHITYHVACYWRQERKRRGPLHTVHMCVVYIRGLFSEHCGN